LFLCVFLYVLVFCSMCLLMFGILNC